MLLALISVPSDSDLILHFILPPLNFAIYLSHCLFLLHTLLLNVKQGDPADLESRPKDQGESHKQAVADSGTKQSAGEKSKS